jgi:hypothetical protein
MIDVADVSEEEASASHGAQPAAMPPLFSLPGSATAIVPYRLLDRTPLPQLSRSAERLSSNSVLYVRQSNFCKHMSQIQYFGIYISTP